MSAGRSPAARPQDTMRLMATVAGIVTLLAGGVGLSRGDEQMVAVAVAFAALTLYLYARWRDVVGPGSRPLLGAAVVGCAAAAIGLATTGYWWFTVCLAVPVAFGLLRWFGRNPGVRP